MLTFLTSALDLYQNGMWDKGDETNGYLLKLGDFDYWKFIVVIAAIFLSLLVANLLIEVIKPLKKALIPSPVLGGFILLAFLAIYQAIVGEPFFNRMILEIITYHMLGIGFIASALKKKSAADKEAAKKARKATMDSSFITVSGYLIQAVTGLIISVGLYFLFNAFDWGYVYPASGVLVPMGFGQGPGQALNWGTIYSQDAESTLGLFVGGKEFGKSIAALGFLASAVSGIFFLNVEKKKGNIKMTSRTENVQEINTLETYEGKNEIESSGNIDKLSVQLGLVLIVYLVTYLLILLVTTLVKVKLVYNTLWGFNFLVGTGVAALVVMLLNKFESKGIIKRSYINNYQMDRISGFSFDVMVIAALGSIDISAFGNATFAVPLAVMFVVCTVATYVLVKAQCYHLFKKDGYAEEEFLAMFGMLTGTASTGVILLRQIDPNFKTPACRNLIFQALWAVIFGAPVLLLMDIVNNSFLMVCLSIVIFAVYLVVMCLCVYRDKVFKKKAAK